MKPHTFFYLSLFAVIFISAKKRVMARMYNIGDINVVEFVILLRAELTCSQASLFASFKSWYQRSTLVTFSTSDENENFSYKTRIFWHLISGFETRSRKIFSNLGHRDEIEIYHLHSQASKWEREFFWSDLSFRDENESSKLLTFPEVSDLNSLTNVHANPGRPTIIKCAYDLSRIVSSIACLLIWIQ